MMEITVEYSSVTHVTYKFNKFEAQRALTEYVERKYPERLLKGNQWFFEWWDEDDELVAELTQRVKEPRLEETHDKP